MSRTFGNVIRLYDATTAKTNDAVMNRRSARGPGPYASSPARIPAKADAQKTRVIMTANSDRESINRDEGLSAAIT